MASLAIGEVWQHGQAGMGFDWTIIDVAGGPATKDIVVTIKSHANCRTSGRTKECDGRIIRGGTYGRNGEKPRTAIEEYPLQGFLAAWRPADGSTFDMSYRRCPNCEEARAFEEWDYICIRCRYG